MHANLAPLPIRAATLGSRVPLRPFAHTPSSAAFCQQALGQRQQQTRPVSTQLNNNATPPTSLATLKPAPLKTSRAQTTTIPPLYYILRTGLRANSTASSPSSSTKSPEKEAGEKLDWNSFFKLRASRRRYTLASSVIASCFTTVSGVQFLSTQDLESIGAQVMGLDPFVVFVLATIACGAGGWLVGPFFGSSVWGLIYRRHMPAFRVKEREFYERIKRFRVDPSTNSMSNPVPDYYGEKIGSVQGYRQWLKDQRAFNRKRRNFIA